MDFTIGFSRTNAKGGYRETATEWVSTAGDHRDARSATWLQAVGAWSSISMRRNWPFRTTPQARAAFFGQRGWLLEQRLMLRTTPRPVTATLAQSTLSAYGFTGKFLPSGARRSSGSWAPTPLSHRRESGCCRPRLRSPTRRLLSAVLWRNRIRVEPQVSSSLLFDLYRFTNSGWT